MTKRPRYRKYDTDQCCDKREKDGAEGMIGEGVEDFCGSQDVETNEKDVVGQQHEPTELIRNPALSKDVVSKITCEVLLALATFVV